MFANLKSGANVTAKTTSGIYHSVLGSNSDNLYNAVSLTGTSVNRSGTQHVFINYFTLNGSYSSSNNPSQGGISYGYSCVVAKVSGNISASSPNNYFHSRHGTIRLKFFEVMGTINETFAGVSSDNESLNSSGCIYHFGYNGVACTSTQANIDYNRLITIYVGDGSSESHDLEILELYRQDEDWKPYVESGKVDIWYNYHGEYREE